MHKGNDLKQHLYNGIYNIVFYTTGKFHLYADLSY